MPFFGQPLRTPVGHLHEGESLAAFDEGARIVFSNDGEFTPKFHFADLADVAVELKGIAEAGGAFVVDLGANDDGEELGLRHGDEFHAHQSGQFGSAGFDHAEVGDVVYDSAAVGVEKHDLFFSGEL